jgi:D-apionolactonase
MTRTFLISGRLVEAAPALELRAGPLTLQFDPETAVLRAIRLGDHEVLRALYGAVRDARWGTVLPAVHVTQVGTHARSFALDFEALCRQDEIQFDWHGRIRGDEHGTVRFEFEGEARTGFLQNRVGLCVLHPSATCAGIPCTVKHTDGAVEQGAFPQFVSPQQPFRAIEAITHEVAPGTHVEVVFRGAEFEMEDQRNWADASFKIYSPPLAEPFSTRLERGTRVSQSVTLTLLGRLAPPVRRTGATGTMLSVDWARSQVRPPLGLVMAGRESSLTASETERLAALQLAHLRVNLRLDEDTWPDRLRRATEDARLLGCHLHAAAFFGDPAEAQLTALQRALANLRPPVSLWLAFHHGGMNCAAEWLPVVRRMLAHFDPRLPLATGSDANFAELNRARPDPAWNVLPCFSLNPQVHAFDDRTLMENLEAQASLIDSLRQFSPRPAVVSAITLRPPLRPAHPLKLASLDRVGIHALDELPPHVDPRQMSLCGAAWTLGSLAALSTVPGVHSLTFFETTGWLGVMETEEGSPLPARFPSLPGGAYPLYHVFAQAARFPHAAPVRCTGPTCAAGLALIDPPSRRRVLVANLLAERRTLRLDARGERGWLRMLDETCAEAAMESPEDFLQRRPTPVAARQGAFELELPPYAVAALDLAG